MICFVAYLIPVYGQNDTITKDGLYLKHNTPVYRGSGVTEITAEHLRNPDRPIHLNPPNDSDMVRRELDRVTKTIALTYKPLPQYTISEIFSLNSPPANPIELTEIAELRPITSQWIHEDGECILFIKCGGEKPSINKSVDEVPERIFNWINFTLGRKLLIGRKMPEEQIQKIKREISIWTPEKAKEIFNAQHVITYPIKNEKAVYMGKYTYKQELVMIKWGGDLTVSFLVTEKGNENIDKYIKDVESAFRFED